MPDIRPSPIAGQWYPGSASELARSVDRYLDEAQVTPPDGELVGLMAPHAGHMYSGAVAAHAFKCARGLDVDVVAVLCPSHYIDLAPLLTSSHSAYRTPLGDVPVDREAVEALRAAVPMLPIANDPEHALEIELPFLQRALAHGDRFSLIPVMMREQDRPVAEALGRALAETLRGRHALLVASSDLSHFRSQAETEVLDGYLLSRVEAYDPEGVLEAELVGRGMACGKGAIAAVLWAARELGATHAHVVKHATSGDVTGDYLSVVGYGAAVIWK